MNSDEIKQVVSDAIAEKHGKARTAEEKAQDKEMEERAVALMAEEEMFKSDMASARNLCARALLDHSLALEAYYLCHNLEFVYGSAYFRKLQEVDLDKKAFLPEGKNADERKANEAKHWRPVDFRLLTLKNYWIEARHHMEQAQAIMEWALVRGDDVSSSEA